MGSADRYLPESAPARAHKNNCWIRLNGRKWFTPDEYRKAFGERPIRIDPKIVEILNPIVYLNQGRVAVLKMIYEQQPFWKIDEAIKRLNAFTDKIIENQYKEKPYQVNKVGWPDKEAPPLPPRQPESIPDYNDLQHEKTELAKETIEKNTLAVLPRDKFTKRR